MDPLLVTRMSGSATTLDLRGGRDKTLGAFHASGAKAEYSFRGHGYARICECVLELVSAGAAIEMSPSQEILLAARRISVDGCKDYGGTSTRTRRIKGKWRHGFKASNISC